MFLSIILVYLVWLLVFSLPVFLVLYKTSFSLLEKIIYSVVIGMVIVPGIFFWASYFVGSATSGLIISIIIIYAIGVYRWKIGKQA
jgi:hypothetical protein